MDARTLRTLSAALLAGLLLAAPAAADPGVTGGLAAGEPLLLSPAGGLEGPALVPVAVAAGATGPATERDLPPAANAASDRPSAQPAQTDQGESRVEVPVDEGGSSSQPTATATPTSAGGGLPHTGLGIAGLAAIGLGLLLAGLALRPIRP